jgi:SulP family sulfate permease
VIAGATLAALAIPEVMGYTRISGTPIITGLYTILLPIIVFAIFGSSRHLVVGADSATAAILATALVALGFTQNSAEYVQMTSLAALLCAGLLILARWLRLGFIANFLSRSVLIGFLTGVGIQVAMGQLGGMFGIPSQSGSTVQQFIATVALIPSATAPATLAISVLVVATIVGLDRVNKAVPGALIAVVIAILASYAFDFEARGIAVLGDVPGGLPSIGLPTDVMSVGNVAMLLPTAISLVVVILAQSAATSRAYAMRYDDRFDENVDLVGLGLSNAAAAISGTFVVNGSPTKTEMVDSAGGRTQIAQLTAAAVVLMVLLFLTGPLAYMPDAVLSAVVFLIGLRLVDLRGMAEILRLRPGEFLVAGITAVVVVAVGVEQGILLAMFLSVIEHVSHSYRSTDTLLVEGGDYLRHTPLSEGQTFAPGLLIFQFGASLYYANASRFTEEIIGAIEGTASPVRWLVIDAGAIGDVDYSGADALRQAHDELAQKGVTLALAEVSDPVRKLLDAYGLTEQVGATNIYPDVRAAIAAYGRGAGSEAGAGDGDG